MSKTKPKKERSIQKCLFFFISKTITQCPTLLS